MIKVNESVVAKARKKYGDLVELVVACEEMSELTKEISKAIRNELKDIDYRHLVEELADVHIVLENIKQVFNLTDAQVSEMIVRKQHRLVNRMRMEKEQK